VSEALTLPLTFSFVRANYESIFRNATLGFLLFRKRLKRELSFFENMIGLLDGRIYYNLLNWYRMLSYLPGFKKHKDSCGGPKSGCKKPFNVKIGQKVKVGEEFGIRVGSTGSASTGSHLHATCGSRPRAIFAATSAKQNLYCAIQEQAAFAKGQQKN